MGCFHSKKRTAPKILRAAHSHKSEDVSTINLSIKPETFITLRSCAVNADYDFIDLLGVGSYGKVHKAVHRTTGQVRAIKTVRKIKAVKDLGESFSNEIEILRVLNHPNVMKLYEFYEEPRSFHIVTELLSGGEFFDYIVATRYLSEPIAAHFFRQLLCAVRYMHSNGIVHRDLKPENLLLDVASSKGNLKLIDFGTATFISPGQRLSKQYGTAYYIAPEVIAKDYDEMCDMWSCGVILYILLSGKPPFYGKDDAEILASVKKGKYNLSSPLWQKVSSNAKMLISSLLQYDPRNRLTARQALEHEWIQSYSEESLSASAPLLTEVLGNLGEFRVSQKLQHAVLTYIVAQTSIHQDTQELIGIFQKIDSNGDGRISKHELYEEYFKLMGAADAEQEVEWIMKQVDVDNSGFIDYSEFVVAASRKETLINKSNLEICFKSFDTDGNGKISSSELKAILDNGNTDNEIWARLVAEVDSNGDGEIDLQEFKAMMTRIN